MTQHSEQDILQEYRKQQGCLRLCTGIVALLSVLLFSMLVLAGCRTTQHIERVNYRDSIVVARHVDTVRVTITDTTHVVASDESERESVTEIVFGTGGSWNAQTGLAENVQSVRVSSRERELMQLVADYKSELTAISSTADSLREQVRLLRTENESLKEVESPSRWHRFLVWWFVITLISALIALAWWVFKTFYLRK